MRSKNVIWGFPSERSTTEPYPLLFLEPHMSYFLPNFIVGDYVLDSFGTRYARLNMWYIVVAQ